jgi:hypothetical protein
MRTSILWRAASAVTMTLALAGQAAADARRFTGQIDDYTATADPAGPWHVSGKWTVRLVGDSGKATVSIALGMVRSQNPTPSAHSHHVILKDGDVEALANGFRITGFALMTSNGNVAAFSGSPITVDVTGGNAIVHSNIALTFGGAAAAHFGDLPIHGVVATRR